MSLGKIRIELEVDGDKATVALVRAGESLRTLEKQVTNTGAAVQRMERHMKGFGATLRDVTIFASLVRGAIANVHAATTGWMLDIIRANAQIQRMSFLMKGMSTALTEEGQWADARENVAFMLDFAEKVPFSLAAVTDTFVKMRSVGIDPLEGGLKGLTNAVAAFGGSSEQLHRASIAIQQMAGKGVISMEELRQQLGEAVPQAIGLMARALNLTYGELVELIALGKVSAKEALAAMFSEFNRTFGGRALALMSTWEGMVQRLQTRWLKFQLVVGEKGYFQEAMAALSDLLDAFGASTMEEVAKGLADGLTSAIKAIRWVVETLWSLRDTIINVGKTLAVWFVGTRIAMGIFALVRHIALFRAALMGLSVPLWATVGATQAATAANAALATSQTAAAAAGGRLAATARLTSVVIGGMAGPIGLAITLLAALASEFIHVGRASKEFYDTVESGEYLNKSQIEEAQREIEAINKELPRLQRNLAFAFRHEGAYKLSGDELGIEEINLQMTRWTDLTEEQQAALAPLKEAYEKIALLTDAINRSTERLAQETLQRLADRGLEGVREEITDIGNAYNQAIVGIDQARLQGDEDQEALNERRREIVTKFYDDQLQVYRNHLASMRSALMRGAATDRAVIRAQIAILNEDLAELLEEREQAMKTLFPDFLVPGSNDSESDIDKLGDALSRMRARASELRAELAGLSGTAAKYQTLAAEGLLGDIGGREQELTALIAEAEGVDRLEKELKDLTERQRDAENAGNNLLKSWNDLTAEAEQLAYVLTNPDAREESRSFIAFQQRQAEELKKILDAGDLEAYERAVSLSLENTLKFQQNEVRSFVIGLRDRTEALRQSLMTENEAKERAYQLEVERVTREARLHLLSIEERKIAEAELAEYLRLLHEQLERDTETSLERMLREWRDTSTKLQEASARWVDDFSERLTNFLTEGEFKFREFAESIISELIRIQIQANLASMLGGEGGGGILGVIGDVIDGIFGGGGTVTPGASVGTGGGHPVIGHSGGLVGSSLRRVQADMALFANAMRYHTGGLVNGRQLRRDEVPVIARRGEGIFTPEQMRAMGGQAPNIQVNVINQSGQDVNAQQRGVRFDGKQYVLDVVLKAAAQPGSFRDGLKGALK